MLSRSLGVLSSGHRQLARHCRSQKLSSRPFLRSVGAPLTTVSSSGGAAAEPRMDTGLEQLIRSIHASPYKAVIYVTGGCSQVCRAWGGCRVPKEVEHSIAHSKGTVSADCWSQKGLSEEQPIHNHRHALRQSVCSNQGSPYSRPKAVTSPELPPPPHTHTPCILAGSIMASDGPRCIRYCTGGDCALQQGQLGGALGTGANSWGPGRSCCILSNAVHVTASPASPNSLQLLLPHRWWVGQSFRAMCCNTNHPGGRKPPPPANRRECCHSSPCGPGPV
jgi:hypothetical protein